MRNSIIFPVVLIMTKLSLRKILAKDIFVPKKKHKPSALKKPLAVPKDICCRGLQPAPKSSP